MNLRQVRLVSHKGMISHKGTMLQSATGDAVN